MCEFCEIAQSIKDDVSKLSEKTCATKDIKNKQAVIKYHLDKVIQLGERIFEEEDHNGLHRIV